VEVDTGTETVVAEIIDGVGVVTLHRPERRNALHPEMCDAVPRVLERFDTDADVGCIVITGAGTAFCAGGDVRDGGGDRRTSVEDAAAGLTRDARMVEVLHGSPKITIAALPGPAVGAGLSIALATDLRIAAASSRLITGWAGLGFSGDFGGTWLLTRLVGPSKALELLVDGSALDAEAALQLGLVNRVVPDDELRDAAMAWARTIAAGPTTAFGYMKANVREAMTAPLAEALPVESERMARSARTDEHRRAVKAWLAEAEARRAARRD
jgi:2-(1,2-epoxy-1,2-dihydrophenyl)acetyl-CoA isomerase